MRIRVPDYFKEFKCIASDCEDTCCAGWEIVIDEETYSKYEKLQGELGKRIRSEIVHREGEDIFILKGNNCPFLNENKLCDICAELGEDSLCYTCRQYPRYMEEFGDLREIGISLSCPEAARIILRDSRKVEFEVSEIQEDITSYNDIDAMLFINLLQCRNRVIDILQNRGVDLEKRVSLVLKFTNEIQEKIDDDHIKGIKQVNEKYDDDAFITETISCLEQYKDNGNKKYHNIHKLLKIFKSLKHINPDDPLGLEDVLGCFWKNADDGNVNETANGNVNTNNDIDADANADAEIYLDKHKQFTAYYEDRLYKFENLLVYFVFRYFMKAVFDYEVSAKVKTAVVSYLMIKELFVFRWMKNSELMDVDAVDIMHMFSKDIEHLEENMESLEKAYRTNAVFSIDELISILMN